jgi:hypothetical protein
MRYGQDGLGVWGAYHEIQRFLSDRASCRNIPLIRDNYLLKDVLRTTSANPETVREAVKYYVEFLSFHLEVRAPCSRALILGAPEPTVRSANHRQNLGWYSQPINRFSTDP